MGDKCSMRLSPILYGEQNNPDRTMMTSNKPYSTQAWQLFVRVFLLEMAKEG
jgi:hypothetical protein